MDKKMNKLNIWLTYSLCGVLTLQPALANVIIASGSANTSKTQAGNGIEVVNIATPNGQGLSHNKYQRFDVDPSGLILNNSTEALSRSQLGGILQGNPHLNGKAANVILNEVTGANRSQLEGYTEVFGQQANVILANPYGITCDGCGFINTPRVTLSTGAPELNNGQLTGFDVSEGSVTIEGLGLDATNQTYFDIISRTAEINANIHANDLSVITGTNQVGYQTNHVAEKSSKPTNKPALAIDSSSLGGMYAGRISLVATEDGVGVNVGNLVSNVSDIMLTADGKVQLASAQSAKNIDITSRQEVALANQQVAQEQLKISADNLILNQTTVTAGDLVEFTVDKSVTAHDSQLFSGLKNNNQTNAAAELNIIAAQLSLQDSEVISKGDLSGPVTSLTLDSNSAVAASNIALTDVETIENDGEINANSTLDVDAEQLTFTGSGTMTADSIQIEVNSANLDGQMAAKTLSVDSQSTLDIGQEANLQSTGTMTLNAQELTQKGQLTSNATITLSAAEVDNSGTLQALDSLNLTASSLVNKGGLVALGNLTATASNRIDNQSLIYAGNNANLYANTLHNTSDIVVGNDLLIAQNVAKQKSSSVTNSSGTIESLGGDIGIYTNNLTNKRTMLDISTSYAIDKRAYFTPVFIANNTPYQPVHRVTSEHRSNSKDHHNRVVYTHHIDSGAEFTAIGHKEGQHLVGSSSMAKIAAKNNIALEALNLLNNSSQIAAKNVAIKSTSLINKGYTFSEYTTYYDYRLRYRRGSSRHSSWGDFIFDRTNTRKVKTGSSGQLNSSITASNNLTLNVANKVNNSTLKANVTAVSPTKSAPELKATSSASVTGPTITFANKNDIAFPEFAFPTAPNGLFILSPDPKGKYLIETNPLLTNMGNFLGSDYFMSSVGFNPEADVKFLGDAFYDSRVISQAIFEQTGQQYLNTSVGSQLEQMQQLIDAAASQKSSLNLTTGIALSSAQVANLTQNILWYEEIEINGQKVLAPKLYLAQATIDNLSSGAQIAGSNVSIDAGDLANSGQLSADSSLSVNSSNSITNIGGTIASSSDVSLTAEKDIINLSGDIKGHDVSLEATNGNIINETRVTTSTASLGNNRGTFTDVGQTASITTTGNLVLKAGKNIENHAADIKANGDANLNAGQDIIVSSKEESYGYDVTARGGREGESQTSQIASSLTAIGNLTMNAGKDIAITASQVKSGEGLSLAAGNDITVQTALNKQSDHTYRSNYTEINRSEQHQGSLLEGKNVSLQAQNNITLSGSTVSAEQTVNLKAKGDVNILAVNDSQYHYDKTVTKKSFGRSKTTINETYRETVKGSSISAGDSISIKAQNLDSVVTAGGDSDINIIGSALNADNEVTLSADGDVKLAAQTYKQFERHETIKKGFGGLSGRNQGSLDDATLLNSSYLINSGNTSFTAGRDIGVIASEVTSGGEVNLNAVEDVLIAAGDVLKKSQQWDEKMSFLSGGNLFEMEKKRQGEETSTAQSSSIQSGGSLTVKAGSVKVVGSELNADHNVSLTADTGDVEILAAKETTKTFESEEKLSISLGDGLDGVSVEDGQIKISLGDASYDKVKHQSDALNHKESVVKAQNDLAVNAESSILVEGSTLASDSDGNHQGDLRLTAKDDVTIKAAVDTLSEQREEIHGKAEASLVVQHQAVEVAKAALALKQSTKKLKQAEQDYKQYKKGLDSLESTLSTLEQEYADKKPGVTFEDIEELNDLISEVKSDEAWYVAGVALAAEDVVSKTTLLVQQTAAAAQSSGTYGFNAGIHLDIEASQTESSSLTTTSVGSALSGQNIKISAGNNTGNQLNIQGSELAANDTLSLAANEVNITASQDTQNSKSETQSGQIGASMTVYGASTGINLNASFDRNQSTSSSVTHNNSQLNADNIAITSNQDTNIKGATVAANDSLTVDVGGDLNVASVQDRHSSSQKGAGISGGLSLSGGSDAGQLTGGSSGINASNGRTRTKQTVLTSLNSGGSADITVANNTDVKGALIATTDENGQDSGELNLTTGSLTFADLSNTSYNQNRSMGLNTSVGVNDGELDSTNNSTSVQYKNTSGYSKSKTLATIGQGQLTIADSENSHDTSRLNRDTEHTEKDLFTVDRKQGDFDVTVDHRLLTEEGRAQIGQDIEDTHEGIGDVADAAGSVADDENIGIGDLFTVLGNNRKNTELKNDLTRDPKYAHIVDGLKSEDSATYDKAAKEVYKLALEKYGLQPSELNFYDGSKTTSASLADSKLGNVNAGVVVDKNSDQHGKTFVNASEGNTKLDHAKGMGAEIVEVQGLQNGQQSTSEATQEAISEHNSGHFAKRLDQATEGGLSNSSPSFSTMFSNSNAVNAGTNVANKVGTATVDHRQLYKAESQLILSNAKGYAEKHGISEVEAKKELFQQALLQTDETWANQKHIQENSRAREELAEIAADNASELANSASGRKLIEDGSELFKAKDEATYKDETVNLDEFNSIEHPYQSDYRPNEEANAYAKYATENGEKPVNVSTSDVANNLKEKALNVIDNTSIEDVVNVGEQVVDIVIEKAKYNAGHVEENIRATPEQLGELATDTLNSLKQIFENNDDATLAEIKELQGNKQEAIELKEKGLVTTGETLTTIATVGGIGKNLTNKAAGDIVESVDLPEIPAVGSNKLKLANNATLDKTEGAPISVESNIVKSDFGKYSTAIDNKVTVVDKSEAIPDWVQESFLDSNYRSVVTNEEITVYRVFGGNANAQGAFVTTSPTSNKIQAKIDAALLPEWKNSRTYEAEIVIPKGTKLHVGKVAPQTIKSSGTVLDGESDQLLMPQNWPEEWIKNVKNVKP